MSHKRKTDEKEKIYRPEKKTTNASARHKSHHMAPSFEAC